jgi:hypothetical protein
MYRHCPSCTRDLGRNEALEHFPVGKRLAYDVARGRLWALCPRCRSWNLAPIEERWEAVEEAERSFEHALEGLSTENIALGKLRDGTELVRIGKAKAPELAGWRYAQRISARWRKARWAGGASCGAWVLWGSGLGYTFLPVLLTAAAGYGLWDWSRKRGRRLEVPLAGPGEDPRIVTLGRGDLRMLHLVPSDPDGPDDEWGLEFRRLGRRSLSIPPELRNRALRLSTLELNHDIGKPRHLTAALDRVLESGGADQVVAAAARTLRDGRAWESHLGWPFGDQTALHRADPVMRLALEIAANEEAERVALEGELYRLELEWKEAEELAAISDSLLLPGWIRSRIDEWRREGAPSTEGALPPIAPTPGIVDSEGRPASTLPAGDPGGPAATPSRSHAEPEPEAR